MRRRFTNFTASLLCVLLIFSLFTAMPTSAVTYTNSKGTVKVVCGSYSHTFNSKNYGKNFSLTLNYALRVAANKATSSKKATVRISKGNYKLDRTIYIYSNTTLNAQGSTFKLTNNMLRNGYDKFASSAKGYSGAKNITVKGGTWNMDVSYSKANSSAVSDTHSTFRFAHCKNIKITGCTFKNNYNCHDIELGGANGVVITDCKFKNDKDVNSLESDGGKEAIQIDVMTKDSVPVFPSYDYTACKNITIKNNTFKNKFRGIGSHHAVTGNTYNNILVYNNTFNNIAGFSIYAVYWAKSKIYNNTFTNVGAGIDIRSMTIGSGLNFYNYNKLSYLDSEYTAKSSTVYVYNNSIHLRKSNPYAYPFGVRCSGAYYESDDSETGTKAGQYNVYKVKIGVNANGDAKPNTIYGNVYVGITITYGSDCTVKNNNIDLSSCVMSTSNGITVKGSKKITISKNTISNGNQGSARGIYLCMPSGVDSPTTDTTISGNTISNFSHSGISVVNSTNTNITNNTMASSKYGVLVKSAVNTTLNSNDISDSTSYGVYSCNGSTGTNITSNTIASTGQIAVYLNDKDDQFPDEEKTISIVGNVLSCPDGVTPISLRIANLAATVYSNSTLDGSYATCRIKGSSDLKFTYLYEDLTSPQIDVSGESDNVLLSWNPLSDSVQYRVYRTVLEDDTRCIYDDVEASYTDTTCSDYLSEADVTYTLSPYISSSTIKLMGTSSSFMLASTASQN